MNSFFHKGTEVSKNKFAGAKFEGFPGVRNS